jgi:GntR family transcriptional repressor for pyruvate dehydrogenase complex
LENLILARSLQPGERLPAERQLGELLGVSRTVVREAIRSLAAKGLVRVTTGSGTYVEKLGPQLLRDSVNLLIRAHDLTPDQVYEVRTVLEVTIAGLAAQRARPENIEAMEKTIAILRGPQLTAGEFVKHDFGFHVHLAEATQNPLFEALIASTSDVVFRVIRQTYTLGGQEIVAADEHSEILELVRRRDVEGARRIMAEHMDRSLQRLRKLKHKGGGAASRKLAVSRADLRSGV